MHSLSSRIRVVVCLAVMASLVVAAPSMGKSRSERAQDRGIKSGVSQAKKARKDAAKAGKLAKQLGKDLAATKGDVASLKTLAAGLPAVLTQLGNGLTTLSTAVQTQIAPNLQKLGDAFSSVEYGAVAGFVTLPALAGGATTATPAIVSSDIPDDGNPATVSGTIPVPLGSLPRTLTAGVRLRAAIRSNEADGGATGDPAGQLGAALVVTCGSDTCPNPDPTKQADPTMDIGGGTVVCSLINDSQAFPIPGGTTNLFAINIQQKDPRVAPSKPDTSSIDVFAGNTDTTKRSCGLPGGATYVLSPTAEFFDLPTSATPGPKD